jgi:cytochrome c oxidase assembly protein subunit 15
VAGALIVLAGATILTGTIVTGSGPHAGDIRAKRLPFAVHSVARVHGTVMIAFLALVLVMIWLLRRDQAPARIVGAAQFLLTVLVLQAAIGYTQYFSGIPPLLVGFHVLGATLLWVAVLQFGLSLSAPAAGPQESGHDDHGAGRNLVALG